MKEKTQLYVISHSHWDREWYHTFEGFRMRLVHMLDELLEVMEQDPEYQYFHLDGQTVLLGDYLAIRPEKEERLRALIESGRILIGPWFVMPDEFLVSGESLVRNLQLGQSVCRAFHVSPMNCGYVVDIFGHNSQLPQILQGFGLDSAALYRGIADYEKDEFFWKGADGSQVFCVKLDRERSYGNFFFAVRWPFEGREYEQEELLTHLDKLVEYSKRTAVSNHILLLDGCDHTEVEPKLPQLLAFYNQNRKDVEIHQDTLEHYIQAQKNSGVTLETITGELYSIGKRGMNNQLLKNVLSSMVHIKQLNHGCETLLCRWAEPFGRLAGTGQGFLEEAWRQLLLNHPHDSICGCSITRVHQDNEYRFHQVIDIGNAVTTEALEEIAASIQTAEAGEGQFLVLFSGGQQDFSGIAEATLEFPPGFCGNFKLYDWQGKEVPYQQLEGKKNGIKTVEQHHCLVQFQGREYTRIAFPAWIPAMGYQTFRYVELSTVPPAPGEYTYSSFHPPVRYPGNMQIDESSWENQYLHVAFQHGEIQVRNRRTGKVYPGLFCFEDGADLGDGWNYQRPVHDSLYTTANSSFDFSVEQNGPFLVQWKIVQTLRLPRCFDFSRNQRAEETIPFVITTYITMKKDSSVLDCRTEVDNSVTDHRLRVLFPTGISTNTWYCQTPFFLQHRPVCLKETTDYQETETGVFPNQGLVFLRDDQNAFAVMNQGLYETELIKHEGCTVALTLFRSFRHEVGKEVGEMSLMRCHMAFAFALDFPEAQTDCNALLAKKEDWDIGLREAYTSHHPGKRPLTFSAGSVSGGVLSTWKRGTNMDILRVYNSKAEDAVCRITLAERPQRIFRLRLDEDIQEEYPIEQLREFTLKPGQILTLGLQ